MVRFVSNCSSSLVRDGWSRHQCGLQMPCSSFWRLSAHSLPVSFWALLDWALGLLETLCLYHRVHYDDVMICYARNSATWLDESGSVGDVEVKYSVFSGAFPLDLIKVVVLKHFYQCFARVFLSLPGAIVLFSQSMSPVLKSPPRMIGTSGSRLSNCSPSWLTESSARSLGGR